MTKEELIDQLNELIRMCKDGETGYANAAKNVKNSELETIFSNYSKQRAKFAHELQAEVERLGGNPADSAHVGSVLHRGWMDVEAAVTGGSGVTMIGACVNGEESVESEYARALDTGISGKSRSIIEGQQQQIQEAHTRLRRLQEEVKSGTEFQKNE